MSSSFEEILACSRRTSGDHYSSVEIDRLSIYYRLVTKWNERLHLTTLTDAMDGAFEFEKSSKLYEQTIQTMSNTALILDLLRSKDEANFDMNTGDLLQ